MKRIVTACIIVLMMLPIYAYSYGKNKVQRETLHWSMIKTLHFDIYYNEGDDAFGQIAALMAEDAYYHIKSDFTQLIKGRIPIIFYKTHQDFATTNIISPLLSEGVGGFTESQRNRVAVPFNGSYRKMELTLIHELTHAYINEMNRAFARLAPSSSLPFWMSEGLPEFLSSHGEDVYNEMFIIDLVMNDRIPDIQRIGGFYAYRLGEAFLVFLEQHYGRAKVMEFFYSVRYLRDADAAAKKVFDMSFDDVQRQWQATLKRTYFRSIEEYTLPYEVFEQKTDHSKDGSSMNMAPRFAPGGDAYCYFSNRGIRTSIWSGSRLDLKKNHRILQGEATGRVEEFHFQRNNLSWFPDGSRFAFSAKTSYGDKIYIVEASSGKYLDEILLPGFDAIYELDVSHDGSRIVFSGEQHMQNDLYILTLADRSVTPLTDDLYMDAQPRWSHDDSRIVFTSERSTPAAGNHITDALTQHIYIYDLDEQQFYQVTDDAFSSYSPMWSADDRQIVYISEEELTTNFFAIDLTTGMQAAVTSSLAGVFAGDLSSGDKDLIFSAFYRGGWDVYMLASPLDSLDYQPYHMPQPVELNQDFHERFKINRYQYYGYREREFRNELTYRYQRNMNFDLIQQVGVDSAEVLFNQKLDVRPDSINIPQIYPYKTKFLLDWLWGGMSYSASAGTYARVQMGFSDLMGNHSVGLDLGISGELENSNIITQYLYLAQRLDYGGGVFYLNDDLIYLFINGGDANYVRERIRQYGGYSLLRYPFNKFWRVDLNNTLYITDYHRDTWDGDSWVEDTLPWWLEDAGLKVSEHDVTYAPQLSLVHDNTIYGSTGPMAGWRSVWLLNRNFSSLAEDYSIAYTDMRSYRFFAKRYSLAMRLMGGAVLGDSDRHEFQMDYFNGVRGFEPDPDTDEDEGSRIAVGSVELRFPFIDNLNMAFPLPLMIYDVRGSMFMDLGAVWDNDDITLSERGTLKDLKCGIGFGPRLNFGYFVIKLDVAWETDTENFSRPSYYFTLSPDF
jgi:hypothetical protein